MAKLEKWLVTYNNLYQMACGLLIKTFPKPERHDPTAVITALLAEEMTCINNVNDLRR